MAKTRLTQAFRNLIKHNIEADIPKIDYDEIIASYIQKKASESLPIFLSDLVENHPNLKDYLAEEYLSRPFNCYVRNNGFVASFEDKEFANEQRRLQKEQSDKVATISRQLDFWLSSAKTVEELIEQAPQFAKYIPVESKPVANLPAVQLAEELTKLGWPKSGVANGQD